MQSSSSSVKSLIDSLIALSDQYGNGVPLSLMQTIDGETSNLSPEKEMGAALRVIVSSAERQDTALLDFLKRIVEKGLELSWSQVDLLSPGDTTPSESVALKGVLIFGVPDHMDFTANVAPGLVLATVSLKAINGDSAVKRQFWLRLQEFRGVMGNA